MIRKYYRVPVFDLATNRASWSRLIGGYVFVAFIHFMVAANVRAEILEGCRKGMISGQSGNFEIAIEHFTSCIDKGELTTDHLITAYYNRGSAYQHTGQLDKAIQDYDVAIGLNPHFSPAFYNRATIYESMGNYTRAIEDYKLVVQLEPEQPYARVNRGNSHQRLGHYDQAIQDYDEAIRLYPKLAVAYYNRGNAYYHKNQLAKAIGDYDEAIRLEPDYAQAYYSRGLAYYQANKREQSFQDYKKAISIDNAYSEWPYDKAQAKDAEPSALKATQATDKIDMEIEKTSKEGPQLYTLHLSSIRTDDGALAEWVRLQRMFPNLLRERELLIRSVEIAGQGTFFRVLTGRFEDREKAKTLCKEFKAREQYCAVLPLTGPR